MPSYLADHNFNQNILNGFAQRCSSVDFIRAQDVGLDGATDPDLLEWAAVNGRVLLTHDRQTMVGFAKARITAGQLLTGVIVVDDRANIGRVIDDLELIEACTVTGDWIGVVEFVPF